MKKHLKFISTLLVIVIMLAWVGCAPKQDKIHYDPIYPEGDPNNMPPVVHPILERITDWGEIHVRVKGGVEELKELIAAVKAEPEKFPSDLIWKQLYAMETIIAPKDVPLDIALHKIEVKGGASQIIEFTYYYEGFMAVQNEESGEIDAKQCDITYRFSSVQYKDANTPYASFAEYAKDHPQLINEDGVRYSSTVTPRYNCGTSTVTFGIEDSTAICKLEIITKNFLGCAVYNRQLELCRAEHIPVGTT